jgi:hypothetical protein
MIIYLRGGLGNQLFQIFTGISYSINYKKDFLISDLHYSNQDDKTTKRETYLKNIFKTLRNKVTKKDKDHNFFTYKENKFEYAPIPDNNKDLWLIGYFQSYRYFSDNFYKIFRMLELDIQKEEIKKKYRYDYKNLCSIHFRYGDYKKFPEFHLNLDKKYFLDEINLVIKEKSKKTFIVFFEEEDKNIIKEIIKYLKENNKKIREFIFVDTKIKDYEQLIIMSNCHSNIISNSSFSWWGAYLNSNKDKIVVRPSKWFGPKMSHNNINDLCPNEWKIIFI